MMMKLTRGFAAGALFAALSLSVVPRASSSTLHPHVFLRVDKFGFEDGRRAENEPRAYYYYQVYLNDEKQPRWRYPSIGSVGRYGDDSWPISNTYLVPTSAIVKDLVRVKVRVYRADTGYD